MARSLVLLPMPRHVEQNAGTCRVSSSAAAARIDPSAAPRPQGYRLELTPTSITITGHDAAGVFYGRQTLAQLERLRDASGALPCLSIEDWPDFANRGVMLDLSRDKVMSMASIYALIDDLASWKINQLQLYLEHTFAYRDHESVWRDASPLTAEEIRAIDAYCRERFIELVPNQNTFGHMERWLKHDAYHALAECPDGAFYWAKHRPPATLNPLDPRSIALVRELHAELLPNFTSRQFNVGCDETMELGLGRSKAECERRGRERVYLDFLLKIHDSVRSHGRRMMFWGDIILHAPQLIPELPKDLIALEWGYEANHPFADHCRKFADAGVPHYVCPGTSSWCSIAGRTDNMVANLGSAAEQGLAHGAIGYLNTDWGDLGHWQYLSVSYAPLAVGAALSWCHVANREIDLRRAIDLHVFKDRAGAMGRVALELGNVYRVCGDASRVNSTQLFWLLQRDEDRPATVKNEALLAGATRQRFDTARAAIDAATIDLHSAHMDRPDAQIVRDEFANAAALMRRACDLALIELRDDRVRAPSVAAARESILAEHRRLWLRRNRPGGLADSLSRFA